MQVITFDYILGTKREGMRPTPKKINRTSCIFHITTQDLTKLSKISRLRTRPRARLKWFKTKTSGKIWDRARKSSL